MFRADYGTLLTQFQTLADAMVALRIAPPADFRSRVIRAADRALRAAAQAEPTNAQILWDRSLNLKQMGKQQEAIQLVRQIAEGAWQPRFQGLQAQAKHLLKGN